MHRYILVITADTLEEALEIAAKLPGFDLDKTYEPIALQKTSFIVRGYADDDPTCEGIQAYPDDEQVEPTNEVRPLDETTYPPDVEDDYDAAAN